MAVSPPTQQFNGFPHSPNFQLLAHLTNGALGASGGTIDCWGYVSPSGREYAIVGTQGGTIFVDLTVPTNPQVVGDINGPNGIWRDIKVFGEYAYSVCESSCQGVQVIDLTNIDNGNVTLVNTFNNAGGGASHNVAIDEVSGYLYRCGGSSNGLRVYDLNASPTDPPLVGSWSGAYVHDAQIITFPSGPLQGTQMAVLSSGGFGASGVTWLDVTNKGNMTIMSQIFYPGAEYSHQGWLSEDLQTYYHGDELDEGNLGIPTTTFVFDCSDPYNASMLGSFTNGNTAIGHNLYTRGNYLFEANYTSGLRVFDIGASLTNPPEVGFFDSYPANDSTSYSGAWSCYPYLPSGVILISDRQSGLLVVWFGDSLIGENFCSPGTVNSSGLPGRIHASGSDVVADDDVTLTAINLPQNEFGYFLTSLSQGSYMPPSSNGLICLGGSIGRFNAQVQNSGGSGSFSTQIALTSLPVNPPVPALPGQTWYFQGWYRDGGSSNFTDGTAVAFQ